MPNKVKVSVVVPVYNAIKTIDICLSSLLSQRFSDYEIIVVDDGSTDETVERVKKYPVTLISGPHKGVSAARNRGVKASKGDIIIFIDSDCVVGKDLITNIIKPLQDPEIGITQAWWKIMNKHKLTSSLIFKTYEYFMQDLKYLDFLWSYCFAIKRDLFQKVGGFDKSLKRTEDVDFAYKVIKSGYKIYLMKDVRVGHFFRESLLAHIKVNVETAKEEFLYIIRTKKLTNQRANKNEYIKLSLHGFTAIAFLFIWLEEFPFLILMGLSILSHFPLTYWSVKYHPKFLLIMPFEFITKMSWVLGSALGLWILIMNKVRIFGKIWCNG